MGSPDFRVFFNIENTNSFMAIYSVFQVLRFPLIPPGTNNSKGKCPNDKNPRPRFGVRDWVNVGIKLYASNGFKYEGMNMF